MAASTTAWPSWGSYPNNSPASTPALRTPQPTQAPTSQPTEAPTPQPTPTPSTPIPPPLEQLEGAELDCSSFDQNVEELADGLTIRQIVNPQNQTLTVQLDLDDEAWIGFAFSPNGVMVGSQAVIGLPANEENDGETPATVGLYNLGAKSPAAVTLLPDGEQERLDDVSVEQIDGQTTVKFTLTGPEVDALAAGEETARIIFSYGSDNNLGFHAFRSSAEISFAKCV